MRHPSSSNATPEVHLFHEMLHAEQATWPQPTRDRDEHRLRHAPPAAWPAPVADRLEARRAHKDLPRPAKAGRVMSLSRKS
jgi:hypothetical protein